MKIDWDVPIKMDDGLVLRADVFRPDDGKHPAILSYGPYGKGLAFQEGYKSAWEIMARDYPDALAGSSNRYQNWEVVDPEKWVPDGYVCIRVDSRGAGRSPGYLCHNNARETRDIYECIEWAARQPWCSGKGGMKGLHTRGNFEGLMGAASQQKWLEVHGGSHWAPFYTDYGIGLQKRFFDHFLKGNRTAGTSSRACSSTCAVPARSSRSATRT